MFMKPTHPFHSAAFIMHNYSPKIETFPTIPQMIVNSSYYGLLNYSEILI